MAPKPEDGSENPLIDDNDELPDVAIQTTFEDGVEAPHLPSSQSHPTAAAAATAVEEGPPKTDGRTTPDKKKPSATAASSPTPSSDNAAAAATPPPLDPKDEKLFQFMTGIKQDLNARVPLYKDDWSKPDNVFTVINATIFAFVIQLIPALIFAELMDSATEGNLATAETLLSSAIIGIIYAIFAGQPLTIMGITGPVAILLGTSYGLTEKFNADYFPFFFWICIWAGLMHIISAMIGLVSLVWYVTPFTTQIFELFIAITFIYAAIRDLIEPIYFGKDEYREDRGAQYATLLLGLLTFYISWTLHFAESWGYFIKPVRTFLGAYNTLIAIVVVTAFSYLPGIDQSDENGEGGIARVNIRFTPWDWQPTADREWVTNPLSGIDAKGIFGAIVPGIMFFLLFIIDHNVSSILTQSPKFNLKKPPAYHWDFFVLGVTFIPCAILGLPPGNGLIPQAPLHARALCTRKTIVDDYGVKREVVTHCEEQRWSNLGQASLMFVALAAFTVLSWIPRGALFGLFLYLGVGALDGNEIWERILFCFMTTEHRPNVPVVREVNWRTVQFFTLIQFSCAFCIFAIAQFAEFGYIYPALLALLVPIRSFLLSRLFNESDLKHLDPSEETEQEYHDEQRAIHMAQRRSSFDSEDLNFPHMQEFRPAGMAREISEHLEKLNLLTSDPVTTLASTPVSELHGVTISNTNEGEKLERRQTIQLGSLARRNASADDLHALDKEE